MPTDPSSAQWSDNEAVERLHALASAIDGLAGTVPARRESLGDPASATRAELPIQNLPAHLRFAQYWQARATAYLAQAEERACPVCRSSGATTWFATQDGYRYDVCDACSMIYIPRVLPLHVWDAYFGALPEAQQWLTEQMTASIGGSTEEQNRARFDRYFSRLLTLGAARANARLLDIGTFTGASLREAARRGLDAYGIEGLAAAVAFTRREMPALRVQQGHAESFPPDVHGGAFDLVTMWETLEHTFDPRQSLQSAHAALRPGGHLALTVPNGQNVQVSILREYCYFAYGGYQGVGHLNLFTPRTLRRALDETGFDVVHLETEFGTDWRQVAYYLQHQFNRIHCYRNLLQHGEFDQPPSAGLAIVLNWLSPALTRLENACLAGPIMFIVARRR